MGTQTFNNTFFHLLALHNSIVSDFTYVSDLNDQSDAERILKGTNGFDRMLDENFPEWKRDDEKMETALVVYDDLYFRFENNLSRYFRNLFHLIEFVHVSDVPLKRFYTNIVRAQLSNAEIVLLFYNGLHRNGREKFKPLIEMYGLLKNISRPEAYRKHQAYCESAFAGQDDK
ncbi:MAG: putative phage abortive infection protein [Planctomycetaceae bacterium]|nr:putative phage abortive infection protein [Planctomycetaceae bacterium]